MVLAGLLEHVVASGSTYSSFPRIGASPLI